MRIVSDILQSALTKLLSYRNVNSLNKYIGLFVMNALKTVFNTRYELHNAYPSLNEFVLQYERNPFFGRKSYNLSYMIEIEIKNVKIEILLDKESKRKEMHFLMSTYAS